MSIFKDIYNFINSLSFVDIVFLVAVIILLILIITLIYFIKINKEVFDENDLLNVKIKKEKKEDIVDKIIKNDIENNKEEEYSDEEGELLDLEGLTKKLEQEKNSEELKIDNYEKEQEEKAIISYDELLKKKNHYAINYEKEEVVDDLIIKKVNLNNLINTDIKDDNSNVVKVISYQKEEEFLKALKELNSLLN